ncbi:MAG: NnrU family protein [Paracoccaceae bacterium]
MTLLIAGLVLWWAAHLLKRIAPGPRAAMGDAGKGVVALLLLVAVVLMVIGYRGWAAPNLYDPLPGMGHLNNLLMAVSLFLFGVGGTKGTLFARMRHPMLWGTVIWSVAHLLVNGDTASVTLFGGIGLWALVAMAMINAAGPWERPAEGRGVKGDLMNLAGVVVLFAVVAGVHAWLGHPVFLGSYG